MICFLLLTAILIAHGQGYDITPKQVLQGGVVHVRGSPGAVTARMGGQTIRLFSQADGSALGLMPVAATETPGTYRLEIFDETGSTIHAEDITVRDAHFPQQNIVISKQLSELKPSPGETETVAEFRKTVSDVRYWTGPPVRVYGVHTRRGALAG